MNKYKISAFVRKIGFIQLLDKIRFYVDYIRTYNKRRNFIKNNPNVILPPAYYLYETITLIMPRIITIVWIRQNGLLTL